jgi:hypothetical protein
MPEKLPTKHGDWFGVSSEHAISEKTCKRALKRAKACEVQFWAPSVKRG